MFVRVVSYVGKGVVLYSSRVWSWGLFFFYNLVVYYVLEYWFLIGGDFVFLGDTWYCLEIRLL